MSTALHRLAPSSGSGRERPSAGSVERSLARPASLAALALLLPACAFVEAAGELTFGADDIPAFVVESDFPTVDEMGAEAAEDLGEVPGFPDTFAGATLAHLQGAVLLAGECRRTVALDQQGEDDRIAGRRSYTVAACPLQGRCAEACGAAGAGLDLELAAELELMDAEQAAEVSDMLSDASSDSIVQIRLRFSELGLSWRDGAATSLRHDWVQDFRLLIRSPSGRQQLEVVPPGYLERIRPDSPQRFALDDRSPITQGLKQAIVDGQAVHLTVVVQAHVPQWALYPIELSRAGLRVDMQPEIVISVVEAATSSL